MKPLQSNAAWECLRQVIQAVIFFGFVAWGFNNGMSNTDIAMWLSLASGSGLVTWARTKIVPTATAAPAADTQTSDECP